MVEGVGGSGWVSVWVYGHEGTDTACVNQFRGSTRQQPDEVISHPSIHPSIHIEKNPQDKAEASQQASHSPIHPHK